MEKRGFTILLLAAIGIGIMATVTETQIMSQRAYAQSTSNGTANGTSAPASCPPGSHLYFWNGKECVPNHAAALP